MNTDHTEMSGGLDQFMAVLNSWHPEAVIVVSYNVTESYLKMLKESERVPVLVYIDDVPAFPLSFHGFNTPLLAAFWEKKPG